MTLFKNIKLTAAALMLAATQLDAALPYNDGDLILGFRATGGQGGTTSYEVNIGPASQFVGATASDIISGTDMVTDLEDIYGEDWETRDDVFWSISGLQFTAGNGFTARTIFVTKAETTAGTQSAPWLRVSTSTQGPTALKVQDIANSYLAGTTLTTPGQEVSTNYNKALIQDNGAQNSYASHMPGGSNSTTGSAYSFYVNGALGIENTFANGATGSVLDLYELPTGSVGSNATFRGAFRLSDTGVLSYSPNPADFSSGPAPAQVALSSATYSVQEDGGNAVITVNRTVNTNSVFTVNLSTTNGTATAATDYTAQSNVAVQFGDGDLSKTVNIPIVDRAGFQGNRAFNVSITLGSGTASIIQPNSATVTIQDNETQPATIALSAATYNVVENAVNAVVTVNRTGSTSGSTSFEISTTNGTALSGTDYTAPTTPVSFANGETTKQVSIPVTDRAGFQGSRQFTTTISNPDNGGVLGTQTTATVTIQDNETQPSITLASATLNVSETVGTVAIQLTRNGDVDTACSVSLATSGGTATAGVDYTTLSATVNFAAGDSSETVNVAILDAPGFQVNRTFNVTLSNPVVASLGATTTTVVTITDNDAQPGSAVAGNYSGLLKSVPAATLNNTGAVTVKITPNNAFTGSVFIGGAKLPISGTFAANGVANFKNVGAAIPLALKTKPLATPLGNFTMTIFGDSIAGTLTNGAAVSNLSAERTVPYDGKTSQTTVPVTILDAVTKGFHTGVIPSRAQGGLTNDKFPQGDGIFTFKVSKTGAFKVLGTLADGTKLSASSALNKLNSAPLFDQINKKNAGLFAAELKFDSTRIDSDALAMNALWMRPVDLVAKHYPDGWPAGITLDMLAARYRAPQKGDLTSAFPGLAADNLLTGNATLTAADGKLTGNVLNNVNISAKNKVTKAPITDKDFSLTFIAASGAFKGSFTHTDLAKPLFKGILFQKGPDKGGYGYFLSTKPKLGPTGESGGITLLAK